MIRRRTSGPKPAARVAWYSFGEVLRVVGDGVRGTGGILGIVAGDGLEQDGAVGNVLGQGADLVERGGEGDQAVAADTPVSRFHAHDPGQGGGLTYGTAGVGADRGDCLPGRDRGGRSSARPA